MQLSKKTKNEIGVNEYEKSFAKQAQINLNDNLDW